MKKTTARTGPKGRLLAGLLALCLIASISVAAFAADGDKLEGTIDSITGTSVDAEWNDADQLVLSTSVSQSGTYNYLSSSDTVVSVDNVRLTKNTQYRTGGNVFGTETLTINADVFDAGQQHTVTVVNSYHTPTVIVVTAPGIEESDPDDPDPDDPDPDDPDPDDPDPEPAPGEIISIDGEVAISAEWLSSDDLYLSQEAELSLHPQYLTYVDVSVDGEALVKNTDFTASDVDFYGSEMTIRADVFTPGETHTVVLSDASAQLDYPSMTLVVKAPGDLPDDDDDDNGNSGGSGTTSTRSSSTSSGGNNGGEAGGTGSSSGTNSSFTLSDNTQAIDDPQTPLSDTPSGGTSSGISDVANDNDNPGTGVAGDGVALAVAAASIAGSVALAGRKSR